MENERTHWEDKLRKQLGDDPGRFPLPEGYFEGLQAKVDARKEQKPAPGRKWLVWSAALPVAAALAFFILNREEAVHVAPVSPDLETASDAFYETHTQSELVVLDSSDVSELAEIEELEEWQAEQNLISLDEAETSEDPLKDIAPEVLEEYLVENIHLYSEL